MNEGLEERTLLGEKGQIVIVESRLRLRKPNPQPPNLRTRALSARDDRLTEPMAHALDILRVRNDSYPFTRKALFGHDASPYEFSLERDHGENDEKLHRLPLGETHYIAMSL